MSISKQQFMTELKESTVEDVPQDSLITLLSVLNADQRIKQTFLLIALNGTLSAIPVLFDELYRSATGELDMYAFMRSYTTYSLLNIVELSTGKFIGAQLVLDDELALLFKFDELMPNEELLKHTRILAYERAA